MATKSFLNSSETQAALTRLKPHATISEWLEEVLLQKLAKSPSWQAAEPIALGSWSRHEICPKSDIDMLFVGPEDEVRKVVDEVQLDGLKLRYRVPANLQDWTEGVTQMDVLAILHGQAFSPRGEAALQAQKKLIQQKGHKFAQSLLKAMVAERRAREDRYDSVSNYLEPNMKYGGGALRDLQQALYIYELFASKFTDAEHALAVLNHYKKFFLCVRQKLHLNGAGDILVATEQAEMARWFGHGDAKSFMREIQIGLSRVSFYADWMVAVAQASPKTLRQIENRKIKNVTQAFHALRLDSSALVQGEVRKQVEELFGVKHDPKRVVKPPSSKLIGSLLHKNFSVKQSEEFLVSLFRSKLMENCIPELKRVYGLVQHDQYHRFTVETHLLQAVKEWHRCLKRPQKLGKLAKWVRTLTPAEKQILLWTALYHDLAKGLNGDHSTQGADLVKADFARFGLPTDWAREVSWLVHNHLVLSTAAFRQNPNSPSTWRQLIERGVTDRRLLRLAIFTAVDIRATNPEAWNDWKESLLAQLVNTMQSSQATKLKVLLERAQNRRVKISPEFIRVLEPALVESLPTKILLEDFKGLSRQKGDLPVLTLKAGGGAHWVRFHRRQDRAGLFLHFTSMLFASGCSVREAYIQTFDDYGVYDWFKVKSGKTSAQLKKLLEMTERASAEPENDETVPAAKKKPPHIYVKFDQIQIMNQSEDENIISFRGQDQSGILLAAARTLTENGFAIRWARVHTWGRQIEDIFGVKTTPDFAKKMQTIVAQMTTK